MRPGLRPARPGSSSDPADTNRRRPAGPAPSARAASPRLLPRERRRPRREERKRPFWIGAGGARGPGNERRDGGRRHGRGLAEDKRFLTPGARRPRHFRVGSLHVEQGCARGGAGRGSRVRTSLVAMTTRRGGARREGWDGRAGGWVPGSCWTRGMREHPEARKEGSERLPWALSTASTWERTSFHLERQGINCSQLYSQSRAGRWCP